MRDWELCQQGVQAGWPRGTQQHYKEAASGSSGGLPAEDGGPHLPTLPAVYGGLRLSKGLDLGHCGEATKACPALRLSPLAALPCRYQ